jgi:hypothetical protein
MLFLGKKENFWLSFYLSTLNHVIAHDSSIICGYTPPFLYLYHILVFPVNISPRLLPSHSLGIIPCTRSSSQEMRLKPDTRPPL